MKKRAIILHPAIAPYRVDFFNSLAKEFDASFYFEFDNALEQAFDQEKLRKRLCFAPHFLSSGFMGIKNLRLEVLTILWKNKADVVFVSEYNLLGLLVCFYKLLFNWYLYAMITYRWLKERILLKSLPVTLCYISFRSWY